MTNDNAPLPKKQPAADWLMRGVLMRLGDTFDRLTGRNWVPSSSLATSELIERLKRLLDSESIDVPGKGMVVPHNIKLKMQWDKFSTDAEEALTQLEQELLTAAADHINDRLYYTYSPLKIEVKRDYFTEGVKLFVSFDTFAAEEHEAEMNVTLPGINIAGVTADVSPASTPTDESTAERFTARYDVAGGSKEKVLELPKGKRLSVGRGGSNDLVLDDASVSKMHASLVVNSTGQLAVADTGSTNGTFINGQRIAYGKAVSLVEGDKVMFGTVAVVFTRIAPPPDPSETPTVEEKEFEVDGLQFVTNPDGQAPTAGEKLAGDDRLRIDLAADGAEDEKGGLKTSG